MSPEDGRACEEDVRSGSFHCKDGGNWPWDRFKMSDHREEI